MTPYKTSKVGTKILSLIVELLTNGIFIRKIADLVEWLLTYKVNCISPSPKYVCIK